jgi:hypothetical protein
MPHQNLIFIPALSFLGILCIRYFSLQNHYNHIVKLQRHEKLPSWQPYMVPLLGHPLQLLLQPLRFFQSLKGPTRLCIPTADPFVIVSSDNIRKFFKTTPSSNPALVQEFIAGDLFGMPTKASATFINDPSGRGATPRSGSNIEPRNRVCHLDHDIIQSMLKGEEATKIPHKLIDCIYKKLDALALSIDSEREEQPDLFEFYTSNISPVVLEVFFGPLLTEKVDTEFVATFWKFDTWFAAIAKGAPRWLFLQGF